MKAKCNCLPITVGEIPSTFKDSLSYYEALCVIIDKVNELINVFNSILDQTISEYIDARFNDIMMDAVYDSDTETLTLKLTEA